MNSHVALVNDDSGERCPPALQLIAMLLLQEITSFLREAFRTIPRAKTTKAAPTSGWDKLLSHRRWSILSNTFNAQQTGSCIIFASLILNIRNGRLDIRKKSSRVNERERRISLSTAEEDSPRGSKDPIDDGTSDKKGLSHNRTVCPPGRTVFLHFDV
ncbi:hypothetical protein NECAME_10984 [Necator americanus]|uniref:Protein UNC80 central region domain-containing protein n=1 Tax=Necator americanus TaxID=51031 RepID=W2T6B4_NECAM|nr:hypothetical protein NECAME_10984 [Necator americanus]ETN77550.1 hypothetical protein NECAME_10984 [Necator americanus]